MRQQKKLAALHREKMKAQFNALDDERKRIASDLHDDIGASLSNLKLSFRELEEPDAQNILLVKNYRDYIDTIMNKIRQISFNMMPSVLLRKGLIPALEDLADITAYTTGIKVIFENQVNELPKENGIHIYRICQEIFNNIAKHSKADTVEFSIKRNKKSTDIRIKDNGIGFDKTSIEQQNPGIGLQNIVQRAHLLDAKVYLATGAGKGTEYLIKLPYNEIRNQSNSSGRP
ncbi:MAG TPA: ATP-binding protein [Chitinophagaceae bacterium]|nr:ATP-binding protein [Chitinophagaceae bacterium]